MRRTAGDDEQVLVDHILRQAPHDGHPCCGRLWLPIDRLQAQCAVLHTRMTLAYWHVAWPANPHPQGVLAAATPRTRHPAGGRWACLLLVVPILSVRVAACRWRVVVQRRPRRLRTPTVTIPACTAVAPLSAVFQSTATEWIRAPSFCNEVLTRLCWVPHV